MHRFTPTATCIDHLLGRSTQNPLDVCATRFHSGFCILLFDRILVCRLSKALWGGSGWESNILFSASTGLTHMLSALTHIYPDDHYLEKLDHLGIAATVVGTPIATLLVRSCRACQFNQI